MVDGYTIRAASVEEGAIITAHRRAMFYDMGHHDTATLDAMTAHFTPWLERQMRKGDYLAWFAIASDQSVAAGLGLWLMDWPPHMIAPAKPRANILNVFTEPAHRRQGLARTLMQVALDWCRDEEIRAVVLHASPEGRPLYESLKFEGTNEMRLLLNVR